MLTRDDAVSVWRTMDEVKQVLRHGIWGIGGVGANAGDRLTTEFLKLNLDGKSVVDLGCNIGFYS